MSSVGFGDAPSVNLTSPWETTSGLLPASPDHPEAASSLLFAHSTYAFPGNETSRREGVAPTTRTVFDINQNGTSTSKEMTSLTASDITKVRGEEVFTLYMKADEDNPELKEIDSAKVIICPLSDGSFTGLEPAKKYKKVPSITLDLVDLYPGSDTYLSITGPGLEEPLIYGGRKNTSDVPLSVKYTLDDLDQVLRNNGTYTIQLIHKSPFETILFSENTITLSRTITVNANIITSE